MAKIGSGAFCYEAVEGWGSSLASWKDSCWGLRKVTGLANDKNDNIYILSRSDHPIILADKNGNYIRDVAAKYTDLFETPHGATLDADGNLFCVDCSAEVVYKFSPDEKLIMTLGKKDQPSDTGAIRRPGDTTPDYRTVKRSAGPFNAPNNMAIAPNGDLYIADGYGNAAVHRFTAKGEYVQSWGEPGNLPGQFYMPHGILVGPNNIVYVADRENDRIQLFDLYGNFIRSWDFIERPSHLVLGPDDLIYVCECKRTAVFDHSPSAIHIVTLDGEDVIKLDNRVGHLFREDYRAAHAICVDSEGSIYIGDVGQVPSNHFGIHKYQRV